MRSVNIMVVPTGLYQYDLYKVYWIFKIKLGRATVSLDEKEIQVYCKPKWEKYRLNMAASVGTTHMLRKQKNETKENP